MLTRECCSTAIVSCSADTPVAAAAALMRKYHVGAVVVVERNGAGSVPIGMLTDRDIVVETVALELEASLFTAGDLMTAPVHTVREDEGLLAALHTMRQYKLRRLPVVTAAGTLYGVISADDIINLIATELSMITGAIIEQPRAEERTRRQV